MPDPPPPTPTIDWRPWSPEAYAERRRRGRRSGYWPAAPLAAAAAAGVTLDRFGTLAPLGDAGAGLSGLTLAALLLAGWWLAWRRGRGPAALALLLAAASLAAGAWHHDRWRVFSGDDLGRYAPRRPAPVCLEGVALAAAARRAAAPASAFRAIPQVESTRLLVRATRLRDGDAWRPVAGRCEVLVDGHLVGVNSGDKLRVFGRLARLPPATNPGQFDTARHKRADRELCRVRAGSPEAVTVLERGSPLTAQRLADRVRAIGLTTLDRLLPPRHANLIGAMLLGERGRLSPATTDLFRRTGAMHVLVVSGLHVGLVLSAGLFAARMGWLRRRRSLVLMMLLAIGYAAVAGGRPPVVRAVVLAEVAGAAALLGRRVVSFNSLAAAAAAVLLINPCELFRAGTQLSFLATATLIAYGSRVVDRRPDDPLDQLIASVRPWWRRGLAALLGSVGTLLMATLAVWLVTAPLLLHRFHLLSPVAAPLSLVVFPLVAVAVTSGLALVAVGSISPIAAAPLGYVASQASAWLEGALRAAATLPGATLWSPGPAWWWVLGAYGLMGAGLAARNSPRSLGVVLRLGMLWMPVAFLPGFVRSYERPEAGSALNATFLDVGHGVAVVVETPERGVLLYDAGSLGSPEQATELVSAALWRRGLTRIDAVVLSHADVDHFNALPGLLDRFSVGGVYVWPMMLPPAPVDEADRSAPATLRRLLERRGVPLHKITMGDRLRIGSTTAEVLHPSRLGVAGSDNANSLVLAIEAGGRRLLLPGDIEGDGLLALVQQEPYDCEVLLAPHHGSLRSDPPGFAQWCRPEHVVISGGTRSADAGASYAAAGAQVLRTQEVGAIEAVFSSDPRVSVRPAKPSHDAEWFARPAPSAARRQPSKPGPRAE